MTRKIRLFRFPIRKVVIFFLSPSEGDMTNFQCETSLEFPSLLPLGEALPYDSSEGSSTSPGLHHRTLRQAVPRQLYNAQPEPKKVFCFELSTLFCNILSSSYCLCV